MPRCVGCDKIGLQVVSGVALCVPCVIFYRRIRRAMGLAFRIKARGSAIAPTGEKKLRHKAAATGGN